MKKILLVLSVSILALIWIDMTLAADMATWVQDLYDSTQWTIESGMEEAFTFLTWILPYLVWFALLIVWINWWWAIFSAIQSMVTKITGKK